MTTVVVPFGAAPCSNADLAFVATEQWTAHCIAMALARPANDDPSLARNAKQPSKGKNATQGRTATARV